MDDTEHILDGVLLRKFTSIHYQRLQCCAGCEVRFYTMECEGVNGCKCMGEYLRTGKCEQCLENNICCGDDR